jgi:outer membrane protein assembly factor BamB
MTYRSIAIALVSISLSAAYAGDWTHWRGPRQTGVATDKNLPAEWSAAGKNLLWKVPYGGRTAPIVMAGRVFMTGRHGKKAEDTQEYIAAFDLATGELIWEHRVNVFLTDIVGHRVAWANLVGDPQTGNIYSHGVQGLMQCINYDGKVIWSRSLTEEFGRISGYGGRIMWPAVDGDAVLMSFLSSSWGPHARPNHRYLALDKRTGEVIWWSSPSGKLLDTVYSAPVFATYNGVRTLYDSLADGAVHALQSNTGVPIWHYNMSKRGLNVSVLYRDGMVYASHSEENFDSVVMGAVCAVRVDGRGDQTKTDPVWRVLGVQAGYASHILDGELLYVFDNAANLHCLDAATGEEHWVYNYGKTGGKGAGVLAEGKIYVGEMGGTWHILEVSKTGCKHLDRDTFKREDGSPQEIYGSAAVADGKVLLPTISDTYCIGLPNGTAGNDPDHSVPPSPPIGVPAHLQIVPGETWLTGGESTTFKARTFDANGQLVGEARVAWGTKGIKGTVDEGGTFKSEVGGSVQAGVVTAKAGALTASARVRVLAPLPYTEDFEGMKVGLAPPGWITSKLKGHVVDLDGNKVFKKLANRPSPPFARLRCYMTPPMDAGYAVQADMMGMPKKRFAPDMGLINCRYKLIMMGTSRKRQVRLVTWDPMPRLQKDVLFDWDTEKWYTARLRVDVKDGKALVRAKVWAQGEAEPEAWTIEVTDALPNTEGSPALYAYSVGITDSYKGTEVYFDNVQVSKNP